MIFKICNTKGRLAWLTKGICILPCKESKAFQQFLLIVNGHIKDELEFGQPRLTAPLVLHLCGNHFSHMQIICNMDYQMGLFFWQWVSNDLSWALGVCKEGSD